MSSGITKYSAMILRLIFVVGLLTTPVHSAHTEEVEPDDTGEKYYIQLLLFLLSDPIISRNINDCVNGGDRLQKIWYDNIPAYEDKSQFRLVPLSEIRIPISEEIAWRIENAATKTDAKSIERLLQYVKEPDYSNNTRLVCASKIVKSVFTSMEYEKSYDPAISPILLSLNRNNKTVWKYDQDKLDVFKSRYSDYTEKGKEALFSEFYDWIGDFTASRSNNSGYPDSFDPSRKLAPGSPPSDMSFGIRFLASVAAWSNVDVGVIQTFSSFDISRLAARYGEQWESEAKDLKYGMSQCDNGLCNITDHTGKKIDIYRAYQWSTPLDDELANLVFATYLKRAVSLMWK